MAKKLISLVIPGYNEAVNLPKMYDLFLWFLQTNDFLEHLYDFELIFVNDGSRDDSWDVIVDLHTRDSRIRGINFSRNYGKEAALTAWVESAKWDAIVTLDSDGQHPIEKVLDFIVLREEWFDIIYQKRSANRGTGPVRQFFSDVFYKVFNLFSTVSLDSNSTDFRLMDRKVIDTFCRFKEKNRIFRWIVDFVWFRKIGIEFDALERMDDTPPRYTLKKLIKLTINSLTWFGSGIIQMILVWGMGMLGISALAVVWFIWYYLLGGYINMQYVILFCSMISVVLFTMMFVALWLVGIYVWNIYEEVQSRPLYTSDRTTDSYGIYSKEEDEHKKALRYLFRHISKESYYNLLWYHSEWTYSSWLEKTYYTHINEEQK